MPEEGSALTSGRELRTTFDEVALQYTEARPGYPEELIEGAVSLAAVPPGGSILEIGCGTGQATVPFARRGYRILCLELGRNLAALAAERCRPYPRVVVQNTAFEDWPLQGKAFDLVMSAQAFDWIPPEVGFPKAAAALKGTGAIALLSNEHEGVDTPFIRAAREFREAAAPQLSAAVRDLSLDELEGETSEQIDACGLFEEVTARRYPWTEHYTADRYVKLLSTYSAVRGMPEGTRCAFLDGIGELAERFGGSVEIRYVAMLWVAKVKA